MAGKPADARDVHIGQRIEQLRLRAKLSRKDIAARLAVSISQFAKYEKGTNRMSATDLDAIGRLFGVPIGYFVEGLPGGEAAEPGFRDRPQAALAGEAPWTDFAGAVARAADTHLAQDDRQRLAAAVRAIDRALQVTGPFDK
jgi:transcriptional regulator with XRE-family HTH domain